MIIKVDIWQQNLELETDPQLFSPRQADAGTLAMLAQVQLRETDRVLDLGCGYGLVGLAAARVLGPDRVVLVDIDPLAVRLARQNAQRNRCPPVRIVTGDGPAATGPEQFNLILCNPPYHTDFTVARRFIEQSFSMLDEGGRLFMVVKRLTWYQKKMAGVFGGVQVKPVSGYYVLMSEKRQPALGGKDIRTVGSAAGDPAVTTTRKHRKRLLKAAERRTLQPRRHRGPRDANNNDK
ncbi:MAG TPA: methyltransferase [Clostridiales bacterium]|nr:methyltransferase [Clostridiales bacterium]